MEALTNWMKDADANPRFYDRCITVCSVVLALGCAAAIYLALAGSPEPIGTTMKIVMPAAVATQ